MEELVTLSFPGFGIGEFTLNKVIFSIGRITVRWYALMLVLGIVVAYLYACRRAKTNGLTADDMTDVALYTVIAGVIGARIYFVLSRWDSYKDNLLDIFKIWEGGIGIYGAIIGGALALFICCKVKKINWLAVFDTVAPGVLIAQGIGRWGNFFNGEAYGVGPAEDSVLWFFRMTVKQQNGQTVLAQPCFLYESLWCVLGFVLINLFYRKKKYHGQVFFEYVVWYGFGRMFIEGLRTDSLYLFNNENLPRKSQALALLCVLVGAAFLIFCGVIAHRRKAETDENGLVSVFAKGQGKTVPEGPETAYDALVREMQEKEKASTSTAEAAQEDAPKAPAESADAESAEAGIPEAQEPAVPGQTSGGEEKENDNGNKD